MRGVDIPLAAALLLGTAALACEPRDLPPVGAGPPFTQLSAAEASARSGRYQVEGVTVQAVSGLQREIHGTLELTVRESGRYEVAFELDTTAPDLPGQVPVQLRGSGQGFVVGGIFTGTTEEWMALEPPAGGLDAVDLSAELPAKAGRKIVSTSQGSFDEEGVFRVVLQNQPGAGESYEASVTVLAGRRLGNVPAVAAPPPNG